MTRDLTETVTPSGISSSSVLRISRIYPKQVLAIQWQPVVSRLRVAHPSNGDYSPPIISGQKANIELGGVLDKRMGHSPWR